MKREFTKLMAALMLLLFIAPLGMWGQSGDTWTRVTSTNELLAGGTFIIGYEATANSGVIVPMRNEGTATTSAAGYMYSGTTSGSSTEGTINMASVTNTTPYEVTIVASTKVSGAICIKIGNNFLGNTNTKNNCKLFTSEANTTAFTPTMKTNDAVELKITANATYTHFQYNSNSGTTRYAVYSGTQKDPVIYKKSSVVIPTHAYTLSVTGADEDAEASLIVNGEELGANDEIAEGETVTVSVIPSKGYTYSVAVVDADNNPVEYDSEMDSFTMPESDVTITVTTEAIPTHTAFFSVNGVVTSSDTYYEGAAITFPADPADIEGKTFMGWVENAIDGTTDEAPSFVTSATMGSTDVTFYAVFADVTPGAEQAASMIINGNTPGVPSSYGTANAFDECILNGKKFQIQQMYKNGDKLQWRASGNDNGTGTMYNSDALQHLQSIVLTYADNDNNKNFTINVGTSANPTSGTTITPTISENSYTFDCSNGNYDYFVMTNGAGAGYLTSIVINYMTGTPDTYSNYCTTVVLPSVQRPVITVAENPFLFSTTVTITCATEGASIQYSFDNENWNDYSDPLTINETKTIYAKASDGTEESSVASVTATKNLAEPTIAIDHSGIANTNVFMGTAAGSLAASVTYNDSPVEGATVTWSGDNNNVATINTNGAVTLVAEGSVTFTASFAGNSDYSAKTATYEMAVTNVNPNTGTITFGTGHVVINSASVTGNDNLGNTWSIVTEGTDSYTSNADYYQVGSSKKPATSITFTTTLPENRFVTGFSAKFGGFSDTAGDVTLKIGETTVGSGLLNGSSDVTVTNNNTASGNVLTVTVTNIDKGVKCYYISYTLAPVYTLSNITGYTGEKDHYYLIASPVTVDPSTVAGMTEGDFDLYRFNQAAALEWENWKNEESDNYHFNLVPGTGYLYAKKATTENQTYSFTLTGIPYAGNGTIDLDYDANAEFPGFNLIGNPFGSAATLDMPFYRMAEGGAGFTAKIEDLTNTIAGMEGVFVEASTIGEKATFTPARNSEPQGIAYLSINVNKNRGEFVDNAIVRFDGGQQLGKFSFRQGSTKVYMTENSKDYAVVRSAAEAEMPVSFRASENGTYTLAVEAENVEMNYLHLIDNLTGTDVDLLATPSYTFEANTTDYASRFRLVFSANSISEDADGNNAFAYYNGSSWTVSNVGEATLQVVDMMGRVLSSETLNGNANVTLNQAAGIYVLRLINGENVMVQKVVVR